MAAPPNEVERRQARLARRRRLIRWAKWLLPGSVFLVIVALLLVGRDSSERLQAFTAEELARLGAGLGIEDPRLGGITAAGEPYALTAERAVPEGPMAEAVTLEMPRGWIETAERRIEAAAELARLDREARRLELTGGVTVESSDGWRGETGRAVVELDARRATGPAPVRLTGPNGWLEAGSFRVEEPEGEGAQPRIWFENGVRLMFTPPREDEVQR